MKAHITRLLHRMFHRQPKCWSCYPVENAVGYMFSFRVKK